MSLCMSNGDDKAVLLDRLYRRPWMLRKVEVMLVVPDHNCLRIPFLTSIISSSNTSEATNISASFPGSTRTLPLCDAEFEIFSRNKYGIFCSRSRSFPVFTRRHVNLRFITRIRFC